MIGGGLNSCVSNGGRGGESFSVEVEKVPVVVLLIVLDPSLDVAGDDSSSVGRLPSAVNDEGFAFRTLASMRW